MFSYKKARVLKSVRLRQEDSIDAGGHETRALASLADDPCPTHQPQQYPARIISLGISCSWQVTFQILLRQCDEE